MGTSITLEIALDGKELTEVVLNSAPTTIKGPALQPRKCRIELHIGIVSGDLPPRCILRERHRRKHNRSQIQHSTPYRIFHFVPFVTGALSPALSPIPNPCRHDEPHTGKVGQFVP